MRAGPDPAHRGANRTVNRHGARASPAAEGARNRGPRSARRAHGAQKPRTGAAGAITIAPKPAGSMTPRHTPAAPGPEHRGPPLTAAPGAPDPAVIRRTP
ncbi:hypothetical protein GCM10017778_14830 [Streptomyces vinaceus]|nr:hypothetical protein GCM10017778_14830 [Streptomyces vinaceus]